MKRYLQYRLLRSRSRSQHARIRSKPIRSWGVPKLLQQVPEGCSSDLLTSFQQTRYFWSRGKQGHWESLWVGKPCRGIRGTVLGAWNPQAQQQSLWRNLHQDRRLQRLCSNRFGATLWGGDPGWFERHHWFPGMEPASANRWASRFGQLAFLYLDGRRVHLLWQRRGYGATCAHRCTLNRKGSQGHRHACLAS